MKLGTVCIVLIFLSQPGFGQTSDLDWKVVRVEGPSVELPLGNFAELNLPSATRFIKAIEIEIQVPREILDLKSNLAVSIYQKDPAATTYPTAADRVAWEVIPLASRFYIDIPLVVGANLQASLNTAIVKEKLHFPIAIAIRPLDHSDPLPAGQVLFGIKAHWLNVNLGGLNIVTPNLRPDQRKDLKITLSGHPEPQEGVLFIEPGLYEVTLSLPGFKSTTVNVAVAPAKVTEIAIPLPEDTPRVAFEAPAGTQIYLDEKKVPSTSWKSLNVSKGIHTVQFVLGGYQLTDNFEITRGGLHKISLLLQISFQDE